MKPNLYMNGGLSQTSQNAYYVDDDAPRIILNVYCSEDTDYVMVCAVSKSSDDTIWHSDVLDPQIRSLSRSYFRGSYTTADDLIFIF
jgi:aminopeptidase-like protein